MAKRRATPKTKGLNPGARTPASGQYERIGPRGGRTGTEVTSTKGNPLPPPREKGQRYNLVDKTKHSKPKR
jgi:hypothetical protein